MGIYNKMTEEVFLERLCKNDVLKDCEILSDFLSSTENVIIKGKYSNHYITPKRVESYKKLSIKNAVNKTEYLLNKLKDIKDGLYTYPNFIFESTSKKIDIQCKRCKKVFKQELNAHIKGQGCPDCADIGASLITNEEFLKRVHKESPDIEILEEYKGYHNKILFKNKYGLCTLEPANLLKGCKGSLRVAVDKTEYMKSQFKLKHNNKYDYPNFIYKGNREYAKIECKKHGEFEQLTDIHLMGSGCQECAKESYKGGYKRKNFIKICINRIPKIYIIRCWNKYEDFYKIGLTSRTVKIRFKDKYKLPYKYEVVKVFDFNCSGYTWDVEHEAHKIFKAYKYIPILDFNGKYECYNLDLPIEEVKKYISKTLTSF